MGIYIILTAFRLIQLTGPDDQPIDVYPEQVVTTRAPRSTEHFAAGIKCVIHTTDGKFFLVKEPCDIVQKKLEAK